MNLFLNQSHCHLCPFILVEVIYLPYADPFCVHMDRYFVAMPMWTMSKALWMFDMHMAGEVKARSMRAIEDEEEPEELEDDLTVSIGGEQ